MEYAAAAVCTPLSERASKLSLIVPLLTGMQMSALGTVVVNVVVLPLMTIVHSYNTKCVLGPLGVEKVAV